MEFLPFDDIREAILRPSLCFREARVFDSIITKHHVVGRSLTENSTPVTREFPAGRKSGPIHGTLGNRCLCRCADVCQLAERILWTRILTSTREISWLELNRRAFAIVSNLRLLSRQINLFSIATQQSASCCNTKCPCYVFYRWLII